MSSVSLVLVVLASIVVVSETSLHALVHGGRLQPLLGHGAVVDAARVVGDLRATHHVVTLGIRGLLRSHNLVELRVPGLGWTLRSNIWALSVINSGQWSYVVLLTVLLDLS